MYNALIMHMNILVEDISVVKINMDVQEIRKYCKRIIIYKNM